MTKPEKPYVYPEPYILTPIDRLLGRSPWTLIYGCKCSPETTCAMHGGEEEVEKPFGWGADPEGPPAEGVRY